MKYPIGTKFKSWHQKPREYEVTDCHTTRDFRGEIVDEKYIVVYTVRGKTMHDFNISEFVITKGLMEISND